MADKYFMDIKDIVDNISRLPLSSLNALTAAVTEVEYPKNFHLFHESKKGCKSYFIKEGLVRAYVCTKEKEATIWFGKEGDLVFPLQRFLPVWENMQAWNCWKIAHCMKWI